MPLLQRVQRSLHGRISLLDLRCLLVLAVAGGPGDPLGKPLYLSTAPSEEPSKQVWSLARALQQISMNKHDQRMLAQLLPCMVLSGGLCSVKSAKASIASPKQPVQRQGEHIWEFPKIRGTLFWGPHNKDPTILGPPIFGNCHLGSWVGFIDLWV